MKKISRLMMVTAMYGMAIGSISPIVAFAAFNDVTLTTSTVINVAGFNLNVSGSSASIESITVGTSNFIVGLQSGSTVTITTLPSVALTLSPESGPFSTTNTCDSTGTTLTLTGNALVSVTVIPSSVACSPSQSGGSSYPGSNSVSAYLAVPKVVVVPPTIPKLPNQPIVQALKSFVFSRNLKLGSKGEDVRQLQILLNKNGFVISATGPGSQGNESNFFGTKTKKAVQRYQSENSLSSSKDLWYGNVGPKTRAKLQELSGN